MRKWLVIGMCIFLNPCVYATQIEITATTDSFDSKSLLFNQNTNQFELFSGSAYQTAEKLWRYPVKWESRFGGWISVKNTDGTVSRIKMNRVGTYVLYFTDENYTSSGNIVFEDQ